MNRITAAMAWLGLGLMLPADCQAYIDPNAGGWLFQALVPVFVAIGGAWMLLRQTIRQWIEKMLARWKKRE